MPNKSETNGTMSTTKAQTARATILVSGTGSNLQAIIDATKPGKPLHNLIEIIKVFSDREKGKTGLARAETEGIPTVLLPSKNFKDEYPKKDEEALFDETWRHKFDQELAKQLLHDKPDMVINAGFMHVYTADFLASVSIIPHLYFRQLIAISRPISAASIPIINLHPSLPKSYPKYHIQGADALKIAYANFTQKSGAEKWDKTGLMIHYVIQEVDAGEPIVVQEIPFEESDRLVEEGGHGFDGWVQKFHTYEWVAIVEGARKVAVQLLHEKNKGRE